MYRRTFSLLSVFVLLFHSLFADSADELVELRQEVEVLRQELEAQRDRVDSLEETAECELEDMSLWEGILLDLEERVGCRNLVETFGSDYLSFGGFFTQTLTWIDGYHKSQISANHSLLEILIKAEMGECFSLFTAVGLLWESDLNICATEGELFTRHFIRSAPILLWLSYFHSDGLEFQVGRFITPHGIINREHFPPILLDLNQPQFLRPFRGHTLFPNFLVGGLLKGCHFFDACDQHQLEYWLYSGQHNLDARDWVHGARLAYTNCFCGATVGGNYAHGRRTGAESVGPGHFTFVPVKSVLTNDYNLIGVDLLIDKGALLWKNEWFYTCEDGESNRMGYYTQPAWRINDCWIVFYRFDYLRAGQELGSSWEHVLGVNFLPHCLVRMRLEYFYKECPSSTGAVTIHPQVVQWSVTASF